MANTAQARKRARQAVKQNAHNSSQRSTLRTAIKAVRKAIQGGAPSEKTRRTRSGGFFNHRHYFLHNRRGGCETRKITPALSGQLPGGSCDERPCSCG